MRTGKMTLEKWKAYWEKVDNAPLETPITWECEQCAYPGVITRRCDVPSACPYCGTKVSRRMYHALADQVEVQRIAASNAEFREWLQKGQQLSLQEVAQ